jgi:hypothetical protein
MAFLLDFQENLPKFMEEKYGEFNNF